MSNMSLNSDADTAKINGGAQRPEPQSQPPQPDPKSAIQAEQERLQKALARRMAEHASTSATNRLAGRTLDAGRNGWLPNLTRSGGAGDYVVLPAHLAAKVDLATAPRWRVELHGLNGTALPIGFDLIGDVVLGRGKDGPTAPDVDLDDFDAQKMGVSRRHVILRPTEKHLYLIDLNSTNGTMHNGLPVGPGVARSVQHNDSIMLGDLTFTLKIVARPGVVAQSLTPPSAAYNELVKQEAARREANGNQPNATIQMSAMQRPAPKFSTVQHPPSGADTPPRPMPAAQKPEPATPNPAALVPQPPTSASAVQPTQEGTKPVPAPAKPAKIMGLRARLLGNNK